MKNFEILPYENETMRAFSYYLGTGIERDSDWFRPTLEEQSVPLVDWNDTFIDSINEEEDEDMCVENDSFEE